MDAIFLIWLTSLSVEDCMEKTIKKKPSRSKIRLDAVIKLDLFQFLNINDNIINQVKIGSFRERHICAFSTHFFASKTNESIK